MGLPSAGQLQTKQELDEAIAKKNAESAKFAAKPEPPITIGKPEPLLAETLLALQGVATASSLAPQIEKGTTSIAVTLSFVAIAVVIGVIVAKNYKKPRKTGREDQPGE